MLYERKAFQCPKIYLCMPGGLEHQSDHGNHFIRVFLFYFSYSNGIKSVHSIIIWLEHNDNDNDMRVYNWINTSTT